ncbi:MAG: alpha/beta hydrolase fold domain-containing protein [Porticoccaceae bacterium]|nr:alpha/beta hydrolase fold domain-containing protein [Porticoccaceae bacterium]
MGENKLDPELAVFLEAFPQLDIWSDLPASRETFKAMSAQIDADRAPVLGVVSEDHQVQVSPQQQLLVRLYRPAETSRRLPAMLWFHGGGYCVGSLQQDDYHVRQLVADVGCAVLSVDYRLAPEQPFPAALDDAYAALLWLFKRAEDLQIDSTRLAVGGLSAGGGLAAGLALAARDRGEVELLFQLLWCPMLDDRNTTASSFAFAESKVWSRESNQRAWHFYLGRDGGAASTSAYAAPARCNDLSRLPAVYMRVGALDLFADENRDYAERLAYAGVATDFAVIDGGFHAFEAMAPDADVSRRSRDGYHSALKAALFG